MRSKLLDELQNELTTAVRGMVLSGKCVPSIEFTRDNAGDEDEMLFIDRTGFNVRIEDRDFTTKSILGERTEKIPHYILEATAIIPATFSAPEDADVVECEQYSCRDVSGAAVGILTTIVAEAMRNVLSDAAEYRYFQEQARLEREGKEETT